MLSVNAYTSTSGDIYGTVTDNYGNHIFNAKVEITQLSVFVNTNMNGTYKLENITAGTYAMKISKTGYYDAQQQVTVIANQETKKDITIQASGTDIIQDLINLVGSILTYGWISIGVSALIGFFVVIIAIYKLSEKIAGLILSSFLSIVAWLPSLIAYLTYGASLGIHPLGLILYPYTWDRLLGLYVNVNAEVVQMCLVMLFISYLAMLQIAYAVVKKLKYQYWMTPIIAFIGLLGFGLGLPNFWSYAFTYFALPLIVMIGFAVFTIVLLMFIRVKKYKKGITIRG